MTTIGGGKAECDGCGADVSPGSLNESLVVSDVDPKTGIVVNMNYCREDHNNCSRKLMSPSNNKHRILKGWGRTKAMPEDIVATVKRAAKKATKEKSAGS